MTNARKRAGPATRRVLANGAESRRQAGTFFAVHPRMALTCRHVLKEVRPAERAALEGGAGGDIGGLVWHCHEDPLMDVALGVLPDGAPDFEDWLAPVPSAPAEWRQPVHCLGYRELGYALQSWSDHVSAPDHRFRQVVLQNDIHHGCSGGPVLDGLRPVGIVVSRDQDGVEKHVLPVENFYRWMEDLGYRPIAVEADVWILAVPIGPPIYLHDIPPTVIEAFANKFPAAVSARAHVARANQLAISNNPEGLRDREILLMPADQPSFDRPSDFWTQIFGMMGVKSRRSVAALLEAEGAPTAQVNDQSAFDAFKKFLSNPN